MADSHIPTPEEKRQERLQERANNSGNKVMRTIFGLIMVVIYIGMGIALLCNAFNWDNDWAWTRYVVGVVLIIYGGWRAYRQFTGIDSNY